MPSRGSGADPGSFLLALHSGTRYVRYAPVVRRMLLRVALFLVPGSVLWALLPLIATERLGLGSSGYGLLLGSLGIGAVAGAFVLPAVRTRLAPNTLVAVANCVYAVALVVEIRELSATMTVRRKTFMITGTGESKPMNADDQVCVTGLFEGGAAFSMHYRGGVSRGTNLLWEINGTDGDLQLTATGGQAQIWEMDIRGGNGAQSSLELLSVPEQYRWAPPQPQALPRTSPKRTCVSPATIAKERTSAPPSKTQ
jgi:hypothetical protein